MCEKCKTVEQELEVFLAELEEKYPATEVEGIKVPRGHHVFAATLNIAQKLLIREYDEMDALYPPSPEDAFAEAALKQLLSGQNISEGN